MVVLFFWNVYNTWNGNSALPKRSSTAATTETTAVLVKANVKLLRSHPVVFILLQEIRAQIENECGMDILDCTMTGVGVFANEFDDNYGHVAVEATITGESY